MTLQSSTHGRYGAPGPSRFTRAATLVRQASGSAMMFEKQAKGTLVERCIHALEKPVAERNPESVLPVLAFISNMPEIKALSHSQQERLAQCMQLERFSTGDIVFTQGDTGDKFYIVIEGTFAVHILKAQDEPDNVAAVELALGKSGSGKELDDDVSPSPPKAAPGLLNLEKLSTRLVESNDRPPSPVSPTVAEAALGNVPWHAMGDSDAGNEDATWDNALRRMDQRNRRRQKEKMTTSQNSSSIKMRPAPRRGSVDSIDFETTSQLLSQARESQELAGLSMSVQQVKPRRSAGSVNLATPRQSIESAVSAASDEDLDGEAGNAASSAKEADHALNARVASLMGDDGRDELGTPRSNRRWKKVNEIRSRGWFGELALISSGQRSATVSCVTKVGILASINREEYQNILKGGMAQDLEKKVTFMSSVTAFDKSQRKELISMSFFFKPHEFDRGHVLYREREANDTHLSRDTFEDGLFSDSLFVITSGECQLQVERAHVQGRIRMLEAGGQIDTPAARAAAFAQAEAERNAKPWLGDGDVELDEDGRPWWHMRRRTNARKGDPELETEKARALSVAAALGGQALNRGRLPAIFSLLTLVRGATVGNTMDELELREKKEVMRETGHISKTTEKVRRTSPHTIVCMSKVTALTVHRDEIYQMPSTALQGIATVMDWRRDLIDMCLDVIARRIGEAPANQPTPLSFPAPPELSPRPGAYGFKHSRPAGSDMGTGLLPAITEGTSPGHRARLSGGGSGGRLAYSVKSTIPRTPGRSAAVTQHKPTVQLPQLPSLLEETAGYNRRATISRSDEISTPSGVHTDRTHYRISIKRQLAASGAGLRLPHFRTTTSLNNIGKLVLSQANEYGDDDLGEGAATGEGKSGISTMQVTPAKASATGRKVQGVLGAGGDDGWKTDRQTPKKPLRNAEAQDNDRKRFHRLRTIAKFDLPDERRRQIERLLAG
ncbi:hypothetical protein NFJ02_01g40270 [Pycnococcus provasolii]